MPKEFDTSIFVLRKCGPSLRLRMVRLSLRVEKGRVTFRADQDMYDTDEGDALSLIEDLAEALKEAGVNFETHTRSRLVNEGGGVRVNVPEAVVIKG